MPFASVCITIQLALQDESQRRGNRTVAPLSAPSGLRGGELPPDRLFLRAVDRTNNGSGCPAGDVHAPLRPRSAALYRLRVREPPRRAEDHLDV